MPLREWLKHAFAVDDGPLEPTPEQAALVDHLAQEVVRRGLTAPALMFLGMSEPLNYVTSQAIHFFTPMIDAVVDSNSHRTLAELLEHRGAIELICRRIEELSARTSDVATTGGEAATR